MWEQTGRKEKRGQTWLMHCVIWYEPLIFCRLKCNGKRM